MTRNQILGLLRYRLRPTRNGQVETLLRPLQKFCEQLWLDQVPLVVHGEMPYSSYIQSLGFDECLQLGSLEFEPQRRERAKAIVQLLEEQIKALRVSLNDLRSHGDLIFTQTPTLQDVNSMLVGSAPLLQYALRIRLFRYCTRNHDEPLPALLVPVEPTPERRRRLDLAVR